MTGQERNEESAVRSLVTHAAWRILAPRHFQQRFYNNYPPPRPPPQPMGDFAREQVMGFIPWMLQTLKLVLCGTLLVLISGASYGLLYQCVMPARYATVPLHFDYSPYMETGVSLTTLSEKWRRTRSPPPPDSYVVPTASVDLFAKHVAWEAFHDAVSPPLVTKNRILTSRQAYYIELLLFLPESVRNREAGLFGVVTELQSRNQTTLARSIRWTQLPHESTWISTSRKIVCLPGFWLGAMAEFRTVQVAAFRHYVESRDHPLRYAWVELQRHSAQQPLAEVLHGELRIGKELNVFQETLREWYYTSFFVGTLFFAAFYLMAWSLLLNSLERMGFYSYWYGIEEPDCDLDLDFDLDQDVDLGNQEEERETQNVTQTEEEPHFEDWQQNEPRPTTTSSSGMDAREMPRSHSFNGHSSFSRGNSEGEWEDLIYSEQVPLVE